MWFVFHLSILLFVRTLHAWCLPICHPVTYWCIYPRFVQILSTRSTEIATLLTLRAILPHTDSHYPSRTLQEVMQNDRFTQSAALAFSEGEACYQLTCDLSSILLRLFSSSPPLLLLSSLLSSALLCPLLIFCFIPLTPLSPLFF